MTGPALTLYFAPGSSSFAPHIALHEVGATFTAVPLSFHRKEMRAPAFRALNPEGKVPLLLIDGRPLTEVAGILFYLAHRFPEAGLWPSDPEAAAQAVSWMSFIAATLHPARTQGLDHVRAGYGIADQRLGRRAHAGGDWAVGAYSVADIHLFRLYWRMRNSLKPEPGNFPALDAHHDRMLARPAVQRTLAAEAAVGYELPA